LLLQYVHFKAKHFNFAVFQQKFPDFQGTYQQLAQKGYKRVNMFLETGSLLRKKGSGRPTKRTAENIEEGTKNCRYHK
jgi:hypothetical protein